MVVIHGYKNGYGGLGDFLRSAFSHFVFCKINKIEYFIDFSETNLKYCFNNVSPMTGPKNRLTNTRVMTQIGSTTTQETRKNLEILKKEGAVPNKVFIVYSNIFDFIEMSELKMHTKEFLEFLEFSETVKTRAKSLIEETLNVEIVEDIWPYYTGIHVRCGDAHMDKTNIQSDSRITPNSSVNKIDVAIAFLRTQNIDKDSKDNKDSIILFTDNTNLKKKSIILGIHTLNDSVHHTSMPTANQQEVEGLVDSVTEFYLLMKSKCNVGIVDSGFSYWSSFFGSVPLYRVNDKNVIEIFEKLKY